MRENNKNREEDSKITKRKKSLNQPSIKRKMLLWPQDHHWQSKNNRNDYKRKKKLKHRSKGLNKLKKNQ